MPAVVMTPLDVAASIDPNLRRDVYAEDDVSLYFGRQTTDGANWEAGQIYWDSATPSFVVEAGKGGTGTYRNMQFRVNNALTAELTSSNTFWIRNPAAVANSGINMYNSSGTNYVYFWSQAARRSWFEVSSSASDSTLIWNPGYNNSTVQIGTGGAYTMWLKTSTTTVGGIIQTTANLSLEGYGHRSIYCGFATIYFNVDQDDLDVHFRTQSTTTMMVVDAGLNTVTVNAAASSAGRFNVFEANTSGSTILSDATDTGNTTSTYAGHFIARGGQGRGIYIQAPKTGAFSPYGAYIEVLADTGYGVYAIANRNYLSGSLGIKTTSPDVELDVRGQVQVLEAAGTGTVDYALEVKGGAHTALTAATEHTSILLDLSPTLTWATGAIATQRSIRIDAPTYAFAGASTITSAATFYVDAAPVAGTNATITRSYAVWVDDGIVRTDGGRQVGIARKTALYTSTSNDHVLLGDTDGGAFTINLDAAPVDGQLVVIKNVGSSGNTLTVGRNGNNIEGVAGDYSLGDGNSATFIYESTEAWRVI